MSQPKQNEWYQEWDMLKDKEVFLLQEWISPITFEDFRGKDILESGCGGGHHTAILASYAKKVTAVDLNAVAIARDFNKSNSNTEFIEADAATMDLGRQFDVVIAIGMIHHTDDPEKTVANLVRHVKPGGRFIVWVYSREGNFMVQYGVEPVRKLFLVHLSRPMVHRLSQLITALLLLPVYTAYLLPIRWLPYYDYFRNFRRLSFKRNVLNVFDKLNAPQVDLISLERIKKWFPASQFENVSITPYTGVSWRGSGQRK